jgi:hypothetical protein
MHLENVSRRDSAFTRNDLLFCGVTLCLVVLMVFASWGGPRNRVFQTVDAQNHSRILKAVSMYATDHNGFLPNIGWGTTLQCWAHGASIPLGTAVSLSQYEAVHQQQLASVTNGQLFPYLQDPRIFMCPADRPDSLIFWQRNIYITSYVWNGAGNGYGGPSTYKLSQFRPDAILEWEADDKNPFFFNDCSYYPDEGISARHVLETLVGQYGGSVDTIRITNWFKNDLAGSAGLRGGGIPASLRPNRLWCNPGTSNGG